jgi:hypothetical protein
MVATSSLPKESRFVEDKAGARDPPRNVAIAKLSAPFQQFSLWNLQQNFTGNSYYYIHTASIKFGGKVRGKAVFDRRRPHLFAQSELPPSDDI